MKKVHWFCRHSSLTAVSHATIPVVCHPVLNNTFNASIIRGFPDAVLDHWIIGNTSFQARAGGVLSWNYFAFLQLDGQETFI